MTSQGQTVRPQDALLGDGWKVQPDEAPKRSPNFILQINPSKQVPASMASKD